MAERCPTQLDRARFFEVSMSATCLDGYEIERRWAAAVSELQSALHELEQFGTEAGHRWRALTRACRRQAAVLDEVLENGGPGVPQPSPRGERVIVYSRKTAERCACRLLALAAVKREIWRAELAEVEG